MSSAVVSTSAASHRLFIFDAEEADSAAVPQLHSEPKGNRQLLSRGLPPEKISPGMVAASPNFADSHFADPRLAAVTSATRLGIRPAPEMVSSGILALDALTGGLPRGCLTEICGSASSGRTTLLLSALAAATRRGEFCAVVDANDALDPHSVAAAGVQVEKLLWVRCGETSDATNLPQSPGVTVKFGKNKTIFESTRKRIEQRLEQVLRATDLLLESGGFGLIVLDLGDLAPQAARYIPLTTWFRFRRSVEHTPTVLLAIEQQPIAGSCSSLLLQLGPAESVPAKLDSPPSHSQLLTGMQITAEVLRSRPERKPARSASTAFSSKTAWAG